MAYSNNFHGVREALSRSENGQSGRYVFAKARTDNREFRIVGYKNHRGLHYGLELATGKWVVIGSWGEC